MWGVWVSVGVCTMMRQSGCVSTVQLNCISHRDPVARRALTINAIKHRHMGTATHTCSRRHACIVCGMWEG